ncbi:MAG: hypothetical protein JF631_15555, partial [Mycobacterium sp.]|nr:hypothetical protein [Mycobacterium sp.]
AAVTSERPYRPAVAPHAGVAAIADGRGTAFDPEVAGVFGRVVLPHPPGFDIELPDGRIGVVARADPYDPHRLAVRVAEAGGPAELTLDTRGDAVR